MNTSIDVCLATNLFNGLTWYGTASNHYKFRTFWIKNMLALIGFCHACCSYYYASGNSSVFGHLFFFFGNIFGCSIHIRQRTKNMGSCYASPKQNVEHKKTSQDENAVGIPFNGAVVIIIVAHRTVPQVGRQPIYL